jgi:hypothetical protein
LLAHLAKALHTPALERSAKKIIARPLGLDLRVICSGALALHKAAKTGGQGS